MSSPVTTFQSPASTGIGIYPAEVSAGREQKHAFSWYWQIAVFFFAALLVVSRDPSALFHAQFYAEDGRIWFADAYNFGPLRALFIPYNGYFQTLPRLAAALAVLGPLSLAPLAMNLFGFLVQLLPVPMLLCRRLSSLGPLSFRVLLAFIYLALPNCREVNVTVTESQWHLALIACLLLVAKPPRTKGERALDLVVCTLIGLTGPFCLLLLPLALLYSPQRPLKRKWEVVAVLACTSVIQVGALLFSGSSRPIPLPLGASLEGFSRVIGSQVYLAAMVGTNSVGRWGDAGYLFLIAAIGTALSIYAGFRSTPAFRCFLCFSMLLFVASLVSPMLGDTDSASTAWEGLAGSPAIHYWFLPTLAFSWGLVGLAWGPKRTELSQAISVLVLPLMLFGFIRDWRHPGYEDLRFAEHVERFTASKPGEAVLIPENPRGWDLRLVKR
jgi:hypothetical protein